MSEQEDPLVLVTGVSGFIATHVTQQLLEKGFRVRGTVRSLGNEQKVAPLRDLCPGSKHNLELVETDLTGPDGWEKAVRGCTYVLHTASPLPGQPPSDESEVIKPAVEGTLYVLRACQNVGGVKRLVLTSSVAAIISGHDLDNEVFTEDDWTDVEKSKAAYSKSKTLAEKAAWKFVEELPEGERFELVVLNPCVVLGPVLCGGYATVMDLPTRILANKMPAIPHIHFGIVDVRDVAKAHVVGMHLPEAAGKRFILAPGGLWLKEIVAIYREEFGPMGYKIPWMPAPYLAMWLYGFFNKQISNLLLNWGQVTKYNSTRMSSILGITPRPVRDTLLDMAHSMVQRGFLNKTEKYQPRTAGNKT